MNFLIDKYNKLLANGSDMENTTDPIFVMSHFIAEVEAELLELKEEIKAAKELERDNCKDRKNPIMFSLALLQYTLCLLLWIM